MTHSRLESMRYQGYTLFEDETIHFTDNISIIKGMNSNGKSNLILGIQELFTCPNAKEQQSALRFGSDQSILTATFSDGIIIEKIKKRKGQTAYTISSKEEGVLFSTIVDGQFTPVKEVPEPIKKYLNLPQASTVDLFYRKSRDKLLLVDTSGSENYEFLSSSLDNKELSTAIQLANRDRLDLRSDVVSKQNKFNALTEVMSSQKPTPMPIIEQLESKVNNLSKLETREKKLLGVLDKVSSYNKSLDSYLFLEPITVKEIESILKSISTVNEINSTTNFVELPKVKTLSIKETLSLILKISQLNSIENVLTIPKVEELKQESLSILGKVQKLSKETKDLKEFEAEASKLVEEQEKMIKLLQDNNIKVTRCSHCSALTIVNPETNEELLGHTHEEVVVND